MINLEPASQPGGGEAVLDAKLAPGAVAIGVDRSLGHAELAGDLLRRQVLVDQPQALALARGEQTHRIFGDDVPFAHQANT
jgi:hypothetical protein